MVVVSRKYGNTSKHRDETSLSNRELYTIITNKVAKDRKCCLVAIISGTKTDKVNAVLKKIPKEDLK
jgi:hypothetical protein